ncbi:Dol-P-Glc:Glc(2)Man(9)GlcNAc(2)-PP-Dol alpha-1-2-glucosyltransferase [Penicillium atrosanguineum]|nr:Dol-P-Glc:Glc(2)Man(9)GlcNAc(2)-PP-Dol alpha-1-2-glucosyltransferase [Penicillium atrosanguineum]
MSSSESNLSRAARYAVPFALVLIPVWRAKVNAEVPEPYLDEVFHVPQAQAYWAHQWTHWDPKLTTPPGLYLWSYLLCAVLLAIRGSPTKLDTEALRATNVATTAVFLPWRLQALSDAVHSVRNSRQAGAWISHTVLNICLFPPLFFFSGLYYTDILALLAVVEAYNWDLKLASRKGYTVVSTFGFLVFGLAALVCRQTNIFWVAVFLGGLQVVRTIRSHSKTLQSSDHPLFLKVVCEAIFMTRWSRRLLLEVCGILHSSHLTIAMLIYCRLLQSCNFLRCVEPETPHHRCWISPPHIIILGAFGAFVLWNDGVVLGKLANYWHQNSQIDIVEIGHKEFHTAGIHLAQMLYIWPYFVFFSWPILIIPVLNLVLPRSVLPKSLNYGFPEKQKKLPGILACLIVLPTMLAIVHFNTIVHPFTLADNRHYVFYVFRLLLGVHPTIKYAAVVVYFLCGWSVISAFGFSTPQFLQVPATKPTHATKPTEKEVPKETRKQTRAKAKAAPQNGNQQPEQKPQPPKIQPISPEAFERMRRLLLSGKPRKKRRESVLCLFGSLPLHCLL